MPTLTFSLENRITKIPCPTQRVLNCSSRCSPPLELRSRSIASRLARSRVRRRTRPIVARLAFDLMMIDRLIFLFSLCVCCCVVDVVWEALFVVGVVVWRSALCFFWNEEEQKKNEKKTKERSQNFFKNDQKSSFRVLFLCNTTTKTQKKRRKETNKQTNKQTKKNAKKTDETTTHLTQH